MPKFTKSIILNETTGTQTPNPGEIIITGSAQGIQSTTSGGETKSFDPIGSTVDFDFNSTFPLLITNAQQDVNVSEIILNIGSEWNSNIQFTVGDSINNSRFMSVSQNDATVIEAYKSFPDYKYTTNTDVYLYIVGTPIQGNGTVKIYFN